MKVVRLTVSKRNYGGEILRAAHRSSAAGRM